MNKEDIEFCDEIIKKCKNDTLFLSEDSTREKLAIIRTERPAVYEWIRDNFKDKTKHRVTTFDAAAAVKGAAQLTHPPTQRKTLIDFVDKKDLFHTPDKIPYADIKIGGVRHTCKIDSREFREWLHERYYRENGDSPGTEAIQNALNTIKGRARIEGDERPVFLRVGRCNDKHYLDLCDSQWRAVEIDSEGWRVVESHLLPLRFRRTSNMKALPYPVRGGDINALQEFLNVSSTHDLALVSNWALATLLEQQNYPILVVQGGQGASKTTFCKILRALLDPNCVPLRTLPRNKDDLFTACNNNHIICFDNVADLHKEMSHNFCQIATGGGMGKRKQRADEDEVAFQVSRPILLNGLGNITPREDLASRTICIQLDSIADENYLSLTDLWKSFDVEHPRLLGALLDAMSAALKYLPKTKVSRGSRMKDFCEFSVASESAFPWKSGTFEAAYAENRGRVIESNVDNNVTADAVRMLMEDRSNWLGTATDLLDDMEKVVDVRVARSRGFPKLPNHLSDKLNRAEPFLRHFGIEIHRFTEKKRKMISISKKVQEDVGDSDLGENSLAITEEDNFASVRGLDESTNPLPIADNDTAVVHKSDHKTLAEGSISNSASAQEPCTAGSLALAAGHREEPDSSVSAPDGNASQEQSAGVCEQVAALKVCNDTLQVMGNFAEIHNSLILNGNKLEIRDENATILAFADIPEMFPEFGLANAKEFSEAMEKFSDPYWCFTNGKLDVLENGKMLRKVSGDLDDDSVFFKIRRDDSKIFAPGMEFNLGRNQIARLNDACKQHEIKSLDVVGDGKNVLIGFGLEVDVEDDVSNSFFQVLQPSTPKRFRFSFDARILDKLLVNADFNIGINSEQLVSFRQISRGDASVTYYTRGKIHQDDESIKLPTPDSVLPLIGNGHDADDATAAQKSDREDIRATIAGHSKPDENLPATSAESEEVHEIGRIKVCKETIKSLGALVQFPNVQMDGNEISGWNDAGNFLAVVKTPETFPRFRICDLKKLLLRKKLSEDPEWVFTSDEVLYLEGDGEVTNCDLLSKGLLSSPADKIKKINWSMDFDLNRHGIKVIKTLSRRTTFFKTMYVCGDGNQARISFYRFKDRFNIDLGTTAEEFEFRFNVKPLNKLLLGDYKMSISSEVIKFTSVCKKSDVELTFYIFNEPKPDNDNHSATNNLPAVIRYQSRDNIEVRPKTIYQGENLEILRQMGTETIDLIATDPPFNTGKEWEGKAGSFDDRFKSTEEYVKWVRERIAQMHRILKSTGSIYLHCDSRVSHYLKVMMDEVFGRENFRNEIVWSYHKWSNNINNYQKNHDVILYYAKGNSFVFNKQRVPNIGKTDSYRRERGFYPDSDRVIVHDFEKLERSGFDTDGYKIVDRTKSPEGKPMETVWGDISFLHPSAKERVSYPTQKPIALYKRIIEVSSNPGDVVLDPFCGSGTTLIAAEKLARSWIGIDDSEDACKTAQGRFKYGSIRFKGFDASMANDNACNDAEFSPEDESATGNGNHNAEEQLYEDNQDEILEDRPVIVGTDCENGNGIVDTNKNGEHIPEPSNTDLVSGASKTEDVITSARQADESDNHVLRASHAESNENPPMSGEQEESPEVCEGEDAPREAEDRAIKVSDISPEQWEQICKQSWERILKNMGIGFDILSNNGFRFLWDDEIDDKTHQMLYGDDIDGKALHIFYEDDSNGESNDKTVHIFYGDDCETHVVSLKGTVARRKIMLLIHNIAQANSDFDFKKQEGNAPEEDKPAIGFQILNNNGFIFSRSDYGGILMDSKNSSGDFQRVMSFDIQEIENVMLLIYNIARANPDFDFKDDISVEQRQKNEEDVRKKLDIGFNILLNNGFRFLWGDSSNDMACFLFGWKYGGEPWKYGSEPGKYGTELCFTLCYGEYNETRILSFTGTCFQHHILYLFYNIAMLNPDFDFKKQYGHATEEDEVAIGKQILCNNGFMFSRDDDGGVLMSYNDKGNSRPIMKGRSDLAAIMKLFHDIAKANPYFDFKKDESNESIPEITIKMGGRVTIKDYYDRVFMIDDAGEIVKRTYLKHDDLPNNGFNWNDTKNETSYVSECYAKNPPEQGMFQRYPMNFYGVHLVAHGETLEALELDKERVLDIGQKCACISESCVKDRCNSIGEKMLKKEKLYWAFKVDKDNLQCRFIGIVNQHYVDSIFTANDVESLENQVKEFMQGQFGNHTEADIKESRRNHRKAWKELSAWESEMIEKPKSIFWNDVATMNIHKTIQKWLEDRTLAVDEKITARLMGAGNSKSWDGRRPWTVYQTSDDVTVLYLGDPSEKDKKRILSMSRDEYVESLQNTTLDSERYLQNSYGDPHFLQFKAEPRVEKISPRKYRITGQYKDGEKFDIVGKRDMADRFLSAWRRNNSSEQNVEGR